MLSMTNLNDTTSAGPLRAADFAGHRRAVLLRCTADACQQGRKPCPCWQACLAAADDTSADDARADEGAGVVLWGAVSLFAVLGALALAHFLP